MVLARNINNEAKERGALLSASGAPAWYAQRWMDADGRTWQEIDLSRLARDPAFLQIGT